MARFPTLGPGDKVRDKHLPDRLKKDSLDGSYVPLWQPSTAYTAGQVVTANGVAISRIANGTSRASYDATEQALWTRVTAPAQETYKQLARTPDVLIAGAVTRNSDGAATSAPVAWPDGAPGTYTATTLSTAFPGAVDAYTVTYGSPVTRTYTQPAVTRDANGAATAVPAIVVS